MRICSALGINVSQCQCQTKSTPLFENPQRLPTDNKEKSKHFTMGFKILHRQSKTASPSIISLLTSSSSTGHTLPRHPIHHSLNIPGQYPPQALSPRSSSVKKLRYPFGPVRVKFSQGILNKEKRSSPLYSPKVFFLPSGIYARLPIIFILIFISFN